MYGKLIATNVILDIVLLETYKKGIEVWYANCFKQHCYLIFAGLMVDYEEKILITSIKTNIQCFIRYTSKRKRIYNKIVGVSNPPVYLRTN